ncbi:MAG: hypothetical protein MUF25_04655 [Pirellulaceae bacterium]|nr:hypothetical protein [Pirellulaceae bacterium]
MLGVDSLAKTVQIIEGLLAETLLDQRGISIRTGDGVISELERRLGSLPELSDVRSVSQFSLCYASNERMRFYPSRGHTQCVAG